MGERIGIAGGGAIPSGLACVAAEQGQVVVWCRRPSHTTARVERLIERAGGAGAGNVTVSGDPDALRDATFVVEAVCEEEATKTRLLGDLRPRRHRRDKLLEETGLTPAAIDDCVRMGAGHPMGPLALLDYVGLDVAAAIGRSIGAETPQRIETMVAEGALGKKAGRGFFAYAP